MATSFNGPRAPLGFQSREEIRQLRAENRRLKEENDGLRQQKTRAEQEMAADRLDLFAALDSAQTNFQKLQRELDERFAELAEARIARDDAVVEKEDTAAHNKMTLEQLLRHKKALQIVSDEALRMLKRVKALADGELIPAVPSAEKRVGNALDDTWIRVLMRPLEEEMMKIESSFNNKKAVV